MIDPSSPNVCYRSNSNTQNSKIAQRRLRWLTFTGAAVLFMMLAISATVFAWHHESRQHANRIAEQLSEARLAMSRAAVDINREWTQLLSQTEENSSLTVSEKNRTWVQDLQHADEICHSLAASIHESDLDDSLHVTIIPLQQWSSKATAWKEKYLKLTRDTRQQYASTDSKLQELLASAEDLMGIHQLNLAIGLRSQSTDNPKPTEVIQQDCVGSTRANQFSNDITQLRLNLSQLMANQDRDRLADIGENQIRPLLVRLSAIGEELDKSRVVRQVEEGIFGLQSENGLPTTGVFDLQSALIEAKFSQTLLVKEASKLTQIMDEERGRLSLAGEALQNDLSRKFSSLLRTAWGIMLATGIGLGLVFVFLARRVSEDISTQVTAINQTVNDLGNERLLLQSVIASLPIPLFWKDSSGRYQGCSEEFAKWIGYSSASEVVGRTDALLPWDEGTARSKIEMDAKIAATGISIKNYEMLKTHRDGTQRVVLASKTPLRSVDKLMGGVVGTYMDITDRKNAESRVNSLARIMSECPTEIYVFAMNSFELLEMNRAACRNLKLDESKIGSLCFSDFSCAPHQQSLIDFLDPLVSGAAAEIEYESIHQCADGTSYPVHIRVLIIEHVSQKVFVACATDLTAHKNIEQRLAQSRKLESIGQLSAGIAHEINTPMQCISGNIEFLKTYSSRILRTIDALQEQLTDLPAEWEEKVSSVKDLMARDRIDFVRDQVPLAIEESSKAATKVIEIVRAMKVMSHPGTKGKVKTNLNTILRDASIISRNRWKDLAEIKFELNESLPEIAVLPAELSQVFLNLIVNAVDAISDKLGECPSRLGNITISSDFDDAYVYVAISDDGCGMPEETIARAFEPFFTTKGVGKGTGQGLAISYDVVVKLHGGAIDIESQPGEGTKFEMKIPRRFIATCIESNFSLTPSFIIPSTC